MHIGFIKLLYIKLLNSNNSKDHRIEPNFTDSLERSACKFPGYAIGSSAASTERDGLNDFEWVWRGTIFRDYSRGDVISVLADVFPYTWHALARAQKSEFDRLAAGYLFPGSVIDDPVDD